MEEASKRRVDTSLFVSAQEVARLKAQVAASEAARRASEEARRVAEEKVQRSELKLRCFSGGGGGGGTSVTAGGVMAAGVTAARATASGAIAAGVAATDTGSNTLGMSEERLRRLRVGLKSENDPRIKSQAGHTFEQKIKNAERSGHVSAEAARRLHEVRRQRNAAVHEEPGHFGTQVQHGADDDDIYGSCCGSADDGDDDSDNDFGT